MLKNEKSKRSQSKEPAMIFSTIIENTKDIVTEKFPTRKSADFSHSCLVKEITLGSMSAQKVYEEMFSTVNKEMSRFVMRLKTCPFVEYSTQQENALNNVVENFDKTLRSKMLQIATLLKKNNVDPSQIKFSCDNPRTYKVPLMSRHSETWVSVIQKLDTYMMCVNYCEIRGFIDWKLAKVYYRVCEAIKAALNKRVMSIIRRTNIEMEIIKREIVDLGRDKAKKSCLARMKSLQDYLNASKKTKNNKQNLKRTNEKNNNNKGKSK